MIIVLVVDGIIGKAEFQIHTKYHKKEVEVLLCLSNNVFIKFSANELSQI